MFESVWSTRVTYVCAIVVVVRPFRVLSLACARALVAAGGLRALFFGLGPRVVRVTIEVGLQFSLYEAVAPWLDRILASR